MRLVFLLGGLLCVANVCALDTAPIVRDNVQPLIDAHEIAGAAVATVANGETALHFLGATDLSTKAAPDTNTCYEIGSISKVFTGILLALALQDPALSLDTPVQALLPAGVNVPLTNGKAITLRGLTTHTSGLPRMPSNWKPADPAAPYADYHAAQLYDFLNHPPSLAEPGAKNEYSNVGVALLGHALALRAKLSYPELVRERILRPLGMATADVSTPGSNTPCLVPGYEPQGKKKKLQPVPHWQFDVFDAAGGIHANIAEMARFLEANLSPPDTPLGKAIETAQEPLHTVDGQTKLAMNWHLLTPPEPDRQVVWHNGQTGGFHSFIGFSRAHNVGVVILANTATSIDNAALTILVKLMDATAK